MIKNYPEARKIKAENSPNKLRSKTNKRANDPRSSTGFQYAEYSRKKPMLFPCTTRVVKGLSAFRFIVRKPLIFEDRSGVYALVNEQRTAKNRRFAANKVEMRTAPT